MNGLFRHIRGKKWTKKLFSSDVASGIIPLPPPPGGELVWPSVKALGWKAEGPWFKSALAHFSLQKGYGLHVSCHFVPHN